MLPINSTVLSSSLLSMPEQKHGAGRMTFRKSQNEEHEVTAGMADAAGGYVRRMVATEAKGWGDQANAQKRLGDRYGLPFWALDHLRTGRAKTVEAGLFARIRAAYIDLCERQVVKLQHELAVEKAISGDDTLEDFEREAQALAARIQAKKAGRVTR
jgi:hypothetical protein